jgi:hypothetical protein
VEEEKCLVSWDRRADGWEEMAVVARAAEVAFEVIMMLYQK